MSQDEIRALRERLRYDDDATRAAAWEALCERLAADFEQGQRDLLVMTEMRDEARFECHRLRERLAISQLTDLAPLTEQAGEAMLRECLDAIEGHHGKDNACPKCEELIARVKAALAATKDRHE